MEQIFYLVVIFTGGSDNDPNLLKCEYFTTISHFHLQDVHKPFNFCCPVYIEVLGVLYVPWILFTFNEGGGNDIYIRLSNTFFICVP